MTLKGIKKKKGDKKLGGRTMEAEVRLEIYPRVIDTFLKNEHTLGSKLSSSQLKKGNSVTYIIYWL